MTSTRLIPILGLVVVGGWLVYLLAPVLTPFLIAALLAYVGNPLVVRLEQWRLPRTVAVVAVFLLIILLFLGLVLFLVPLLQRQVIGFAAKMPGYLDWLQHTLIPRLQGLLGSDLPLDLESVKQAVIANWQEVGDWLGIVATYAATSGLRLLTVLLNLILIPVVTFYLLLDWQRLLAGILKLIPPSLRRKVKQLARETDEVLGHFLRGQMLVMLVLAVIYSVGLWLLRIDLAVPIGLFAGLVSFVPYLGFISGVLAAGIAAYLQFHDATILLGVLAVFLAGQVLESLWLSPRLVGSRIGLHPVAVIFAVLAGGQLFGFFGILLALPAAAALMVWLRHVYDGYTASALYRAKGKRRSTRRSRP